MFKKKIKSLDKSYSGEIFFQKPDKYREIEKLSSKFDNLNTMGSCNSYAPASFKKNTFSMEFTKFNRIIEFDKNNQLITVEAGIKLYELFNFTLLHGLWLPQIPGYPSITIGGIIASNSHGKSCGFHGTIKRQVRKIKLFHKINGWLNLSDNENKNIFDLTIGGLGLTGTIVEVQLKLENFLANNFITKIDETYSSKDTLNKMNFNTDKEIFYYSWNRSDNFQNFGKGLIFKNEINLNKISNNKIKIKLKENNINKNFLINFWNKYSIKLAQTLYHNYFKIFKSKKYEEDFQSVIFPFTGKEFYFKLFGKKGFIETQIIVPLNKKEIFIDEVEFLYKKHNPQITLYSLKNFKGEKNYLRFEDNGVCFTFDFTRSNKNLSFINELDKICEKYQLTPSIIKDSRLKLETIKKCYYDYDKFKDEIFKFDTKRTYKSALTDKLMI